MQRLQVKYETVKTLLPLSRVKVQDSTARIGAIFYGTTTHTAYEVIDLLRHRGIVINTLRIRAFPFQKEVMDFIGKHELVLVIEQNRDGQMRTLLINEGNLSPDKLISITSYDGLPISSRSLARNIDEVFARMGLFSQQAAVDKGGVQ